MKLLSDKITVFMGNSEASALARRKSRREQRIGKQFSMGLIGGGNKWGESNQKGRGQIFEAHKQVLDVPLPIPFHREH